MVSCVREKCIYQWKTLQNSLDYQLRLHTGWWGKDILKELEEFYMLEKETEKSDARKVAVLMKGYLQSMKYQKLLEMLSQEQEEVITEYCNAIFSSGAETEEFFYRLGLKDGLSLKNTVKSVLEMIS